ncbi:MAG: hypothetical protein ACREO9_04625, partial [Lysobacterales bacterium]
VKALNRANDEVRRTSGSWTLDSPQVKAMAKWTKANPKEVKDAVSLYTFPTLEEQASATWLGGGAAKAMGDTAAFLKDQGRVQEVKPSYAAFVTDVYIKKALGK